MALPVVSARVIVYSIIQPYTPTDDNRWCPGGYRVCVFVCVCVYVCVCVCVHLCVCVCVGVCLEITKAWPGRCNQIEARPGVFKSMLQVCVCVCV